MSFEAVFLGFPIFWPIRFQCRTTLVLRWTPSTSFQTTTTIITTITTITTTITIIITTTTTTTTATTMTIKMTTKMATAITIATTTTALNQKESRSAFATPTTATSALESFRRQPPSRVRSKNGDR